MHINTTVKLNLTSQLLFKFLRIHNMTVSSNSALKENHMKFIHILFHTHLYNANRRVNIKFTSNAVHSCNLPGNHVVHIETLPLSGHHHLSSVASEVSRGDGEILHMNALKFRIHFSVHLRLERDTKLSVRTFSTN